MGLGDAIRKVTSTVASVADNVDQAPDQAADVLRAGVDAVSQDVNKTVTDVRDNSPVESWGQSDRVSRFVSNGFEQATGKMQEAARVIGNIDGLKVASPDTESSADSQNYSDQYHDQSAGTLTEASKHRLRKNAD